MDFEQTFPIYDIPNCLEPVLQDLIASAPIQRLKRVHQLGAAHFLRPDWNTKRFEHSVGVMLFLRRHGAPIEEQVAGLLHDVSHLAFSHVIDFVFPNHEEDFAASLIGNQIAQGEIAAILQRYGFDPARIADAHAFPLLEQPRPHICADRFDYSVRDALSFGLIDLPTARAFHGALAVVDGMFCFSSVDAAVEFARIFLMDDYIYASPRYISLYFMLAEAIRTALDAGELTEADLLSDDHALTARLLASAHPRVTELMGVIHNGFTVRIDEKNPHYVSTKKIRYVDPLVSTSDGLQPVSQLHSAFRTELADHLADRSAPLKLRIVPL